MAGFAAAAGAVASALSLIYPIAESIIREHNSTKVAKLRKDLEQILSRFNSKIDNYRNALERKGINYNILMDKLAYVSPSGEAAMKKRMIEKQYKQDVDTINSIINETTDKMNQYSALKNEEINRLESKGPIRTILNN